MKRRLLPLLTAFLLIIGILPGAVSAEGNAPARGVLPFRPADPAAYYQAKAELDAEAPTASTVSEPTSGKTPTDLLSWQGLGANGFTPADTTGAIGPSSYIEMVNAEIGVYDRSGNLLSSNTEAGFTSQANACGDGQILYDPHDQRFYFAMLSISNCPSGSSFGLIFGFSKTSTPSANASDWCAYNSTFGVYGAALPDYPKLGTTADFLLIGNNRFAGSFLTYQGSDVAWASKPAVGAISTCPSLSSFQTGVQQTLLNADGTKAFTPVPGRQTDASGTGYVVASKSLSSTRSSANYLSVFQVTKGSTGAAIFGAATPVTVSSYKLPPSAPQAGTTKKLDTLDSRLTNAWLAPDPNHGGAVALWTQHTVKASTGGLGSEVRWYEINPATATLFQRGVVHNSSLYVFMGAVSPDRNGATGQFGGNAVIGFNTSSSTALATAQMVSKVGSSAQSGFVQVATSTAAETDSVACSSSPCRWGDYNGASPDPASTTTGSVWLTAMLSGPGSVTPGWTSENWEATP